MPRHEGIRCGGFTSGDFAHCQREQLAGRAPFSPASATYRHRLSGNCLCGVMHGGGFGYTPAPAPRPRAPTPIRPTVNADPVRRRVVAQYTYVNRESEPVFQVVRYEPKGFAQRRPDGAGGWVWGLADVEQVPYHADELALLLPGSLVFVTEGEVDTDGLRTYGLNATCNAGGAGKWRAEYSPYLTGQHVVILVDNDAPGLAHGEKTAAMLHGIAASVKVIRLPGLPDRGDVTDWLAAGGRPDQLIALAEVWPEWRPAHTEPAPVDVGKCSGRDPCCRWRRLVQDAATNEGSREYLATYIALDKHWRGREYKGESVTEGYRIWTGFLGERAGCARGTILSTVKTLSARGVVRYWPRHVRPYDVDPKTGKPYGKAQQHTMIAVDGGPDAALERFAAMAKEPEKRGGNRRPIPLAHCAGCGSADVAAVCESCSEVQDTEQIRAVRRGENVATTDIDGVGF